MKRLYLQIYLTVLASLVAFAVAAGFLWWVYIDQFAPRHPMDVIGEAALALPDGTAPVEKQQQALRRFAERVRGDAALYAPDRSLIAQAGRPLPPPEQGRVFGGRMQGEGGPRAWSMPLADGRWLVARVPREHWRGRRPGPLLLLALAALAVGVGAYPVVRRVTLRETHVGLVIGVPNAPAAARHVLVEQCRIFGHVRPGSTLLCLQGRCEDITLRRNIFAHGGTGLSLLAAGGALPERCELAHNSWHDVESWIGWTGEVPASTTLRIHDNLIVAAGSMNADARALSSLPSDEPVYQNNRLLNSGAGVFAPAAASVEDLPLVSLDPADPDYLKPDFAEIKNRGTLTLPLPGRYATENEPE